MIIYNVTTKVAWPVHEAWVQWMRDIHIPEVIGTGCFEKHQFVRLLETDEEDGPTYAVQYYAGSMAKYEEYLQLYRPSLRQQILAKWGSHTIGFSSLMQIVD